jgi:hypothetical protein
MSTHRKKPVEITAYEFFGGETSGRDLAHWCGGRYRYEVKPSDPTDVAEWIDIPTLEGVMRASKGDWIIRGVEGEFYPCKPGIFAATYERIQDHTNGSHDA